MLPFFARVRGRLKNKRGKREIDGWYEMTGVEEKGNPEGHSVGNLVRGGGGGSRRENGFWGHFSYF